MSDSDASGTSFSRAQSINYFGDTCGVCHFPQGMVWPYLPYVVRNGNFEYIPTFGGDDGRAQHINDLGQVFGGSRNATDNIRAYAWQNGNVLDLGTLGGTISEAWAINIHGEVVGFSRLASGQVRPFLWTAKAGMVDLGTLSGGSGANAINSRNYVVGDSTTASGQTHAFLWTAETGMVKLETLGGTRSNAWAINDRGQVAGFSTMAGSGAAHAVLWQ